MDSQAELLGPLLVEEKLLVPEQLELALQFAQSSGLPLDQIVVAEFAVPQPDISRLLERMSRGADDAGEWGVEPIAPDLPPVRPLGFIRRPIGQIFVDLGFITPDDREAALNVQRESGGLLGEILIEQGKLTRLELANALSEHWESATADGGDTPEPRRVPVEVRSLEEAPQVDMAAIADLRRALDELEAARIADAQAMEARVADISEAVAAVTSRADDEFQRATTERLQELEQTIESATSRSAAAVDLEARIDALAAATVELRSELDSLPSGPVDAEPDGRVDELAQAIEAGSQNMADRLATLAVELRAETTTRTDDLSAELRALAEAVEGSRPADAEVATTAINELRERLDELASLRAEDHEATLAAQSQAAADASHIEQTLRSELEALASRPEAGEQDGRVDEIAQTIEALTQTTDDRLSSLASELRALGEQVERSRAADAEAARTASDQLRENLEAELEALASRQAAGEPDGRVDEIAQAIDALTQTTDERLTTLATQLHSLTEDVERSRAADAEAARTASDQLRENLEAELEALASRQAAGEPDGRVDEIAQTIEALTQTTDERLTTLATELRAETGAHSDTIAAEHRAQIDDLAASVDGLREAVAGSHETNRNATAWADESRALLDRLDELDAARSEEGEATRVAGDALRERLDELVALRVTDLEAAQAAQELAAAETNRIEQTLVGGLAELAIQVDELAIELRERAAHAEPVALDSAPAAEHVDTRGSVASKKGSKRDKTKKKKKPKH